MYRFSFPTLIHFGPGVRKKIGDYMKSNGCKRPLVVTDKGIGALPMYKEIQEYLSSAGLKVAGFDGIWGNPVKSQVTAGVSLSLGLAMGMLLGGAPRPLILIALAPAAVMGLTLADRRAASKRGSTAS